MKDKIINYIKAGYPGLFVVSHEEPRVEAIMREVLEALNKTVSDGEEFTLRAWSVTEGVIDISRNGRNLGAQDPMELLAQFMDAPDRTVYLLRDFHPFTEDKNPLVHRKIRDCLSQAKSRNKVMVILGCRLTLPPELEKEITVINFDLPDKAQLRAILHGLMESNGQTKNIPEESAVVNAAAGMTSTEAENAFAMSVVEKGKVCPTVIHREKTNAIEKGGLLTVMDSKLTLDDIGGLHHLKQWLIEKKDQFQDGAAEYGLEPPRGIMMVGQPGCGKTETAKAVNTVFGIPVLRLNAADLFASHVGESEANWRKVHETAKAMAPCGVFIDELDGVGGTGENLDSGVTDRVVKSILQSMEENDGIFWMGTANDIDKIKTPLLRRFEEVWYVDLPTTAEREAIFAIQLGRVKRDPKKFDLAALAAASNEFSGAEIKKVVKSALSRAFADGRREPTTADLLAVAKEFVPLARTAADDIARRRKRLEGVARAASLPEGAAPSTGRKLASKIGAFRG